MNINRIGSRGAQILAKMLVNNHCLEEVDLSYNEIFNDGIQVLCQGLIQNHGLKRMVLWYNGIEDTAARQIARALQKRSKQQYYRHEMAQAIAHSRRDEFFECIARKGAQSIYKKDPNQETYPICERIVDYLPIYMYFQVDLSHNSRISRHGISALLEVANLESIVGLKELLSKDRREREKAALAKTSLY